MFTLCDLHLPNTTHFTQMIVRSFFTPQETLLTSMYYNMAEYMYVYVVYTCKFALPMTLFFCGTIGYNRVLC